MKLLFLGVFLLPLIASKATGQSPDPPLLFRPGNAITSNKSLIFEIDLKAPLPAGAVWLEIQATSVATSDLNRCYADGLSLFTSTTLSDVQSRLAGTRGLPFRECTSGKIGQIQRYQVSSLEKNIYVAVLNKVSETYTLEAKFRESASGQRGASGSLATKRAQPWHAMLRRSSNFGSMEPVCSGALLSNCWIVTAARCLNRIAAEEASGRRFDVRLGANSSEGDDQQTISFTSDDVVLHPQFDSFLSRNDVGLIRLRSAASLPRNNSLSLPNSVEEDWVRDGLEARTTYWDIDSRALSPTFLREEKLTVLSSEKCSQLAAYVGLSNPLDGPTHVCLSRAEPFSYCVGDSGSPLVAENGGQPVLLGLLTSGRRCNSSANEVVYTSILSYGQWIQTAIESSSWPAYWYPRAVKIPFQHSNGGSFGPTPFKGVLMALETRSFTPSVQTYFGWRNPPHFTVHQDGPNVKIYQHYPINVAARALMQGRTPLVNAIEIELAWLSTEIHTIEHEMKKKLGDLMRWIEQETGIVRSSRAFYQPFDAYGTQAMQRMTELEWKDFNGWCGRQHIPGQENSDPGVIDIDFLLSYNVQDRMYDFRLQTAADSGFSPSGVQISLAGEWKSSKPYQIDADKLKSGSFQRQTTAEVAIVTKENLGPLNRVRLEATGAPISWSVDTIKVTTAERGTNLTYTFPINQRFLSGELTSQVFTVNGAFDKLSANYVAKADTISWLTDGLGDCSLSSVRGLANQIIHQFVCDHGEAPLADIANYSFLCFDSAVTPLMQVDAASSLRSFLTDFNGTSLTVTSAFRSLPEQYVLNKWHQRNVCSQFGNVDNPGKSEYMEGLSIDVEQFNVFKINSSKFGFAWGGALAPKRFTYNKRGRLNAVQIQTEMIKSFQRLWNLNNPNQGLTVDGAWSDLVESKLLQSPVSGFYNRPVCPFKKPSVPCCKAGREKGVCTVPAQCGLNNASCSTLLKPRLCEDTMFTTCCSKEKSDISGFPSQNRQESNHYAITVLIGEVSNSSTDVDVHVRLIGSHGDSGDIILKRPNGVNSSEYSIFHNFTSYSNLGEILYVDIGHSDNRFNMGFYLETVLIVSSADLLKQRYNFYCNCWLDSSKGSIRKILKTASSPLPQIKSCSDSGIRTVADVLESSSQCSFYFVLGLAQQVVDQLICNGVPLSYFGNDPTLCTSSKTFPYMISEAYWSLRNRTTHKSFSVYQAMNPFIFQFLRNKWAEKGLCGKEASQAFGTETYDQGTAISLASVDEFYLSLKDSSVWLKPKGANFIKYSKSSFNVVNEQIKAFQQLWNWNFPKSSIAVTGVFDKATAGALLISPAGGFSSGAQCSLPKRLGSPCCTADMKRGLCVASATCDVSKSRRGYCPSSNSVCCLGKSSLDIEFPSGLKFPDSLPPIDLIDEFSDPSNLHDVPLINGSGQGELLVSTNFRLKQFFDPTSEYLRLNPLLVQCLQLTQDTSDSDILIMKGYETKSTARNEGNVFSAHRSGNAAAIAYVDKTPSLKLAEQVLSACLSWLRRSGRDLSIGLTDEATVQVEIQDTFTAWSSSRANLSTEAFQLWIINRTKTLKSPGVPSPQCGKGVLSVGQTFPLGTDDKVSCGKIDGIIKRRSADFDRLVQYSLPGIAFSSEEANDTWCGWPSRNCADCRASPVGYSTDLKCADRMMTERLRSHLAALQRIVSAEFPGRVIIVREAWDEATSSSTYDWGSFNNQSLHYEGRAAEIAISTNLSLTPNEFLSPPSDDSLLGRLSYIAATCAGFDHVWFKDNHTLQVAVKKSIGPGTTVRFSNYSEFLCVSPPSYMLELYAVDAESDNVVGDACLFDSDGRESEMMLKNHRLKEFLSPDFSRYFRLHPMIPLTLSMVSEKLWAELKTNFLVKKGYEKSSSSDETASPFSRLHYLGQGIEISAKSVSMLDLAAIVIETAGQYLTTQGYGFGIELSDTSLYYDIRPKGLHFWSTSEKVPQVMWKDFVHSKLLQAPRRVHLSESTNCEYAGLAAPSSAYQYTPPSVQSNALLSDCFDTDDSVSFCEATKRYQHEQVERIWRAVKQRWQFHRSQNDVKRALDMCFELLCGRCYKGEKWEQKKEHCSNLLHWLPFGLGEGNDVSAVLVRENENLKTLVCESRNYSCLEKTELFSVLAPSVYALYPLQEGSSTKGELYSAGSNPLPVMKIIEEMFAMHVSGVVTVFVTNSREMVALKDTLKVLMAYNHNVSKIVFVSFESQRENIISFVESSVAEWTSSLCATDSPRKYLTSYTVSSFSALA